MPDRPLRNKLDAADAALGALATCRDDEVPVQFRAGKFSDDDKGWYYAVQFRRVIGNTVDAVRRPDQTERDHASIRQAILAWVQSDSTHWPIIPEDETNG